MASDLTVLVGDVGGSNTRLALAGPEIGVTGLKHFPNDSYSSLDEVLAAYCAQPDLPPLQGCCLAVAGPVYGGTGRLTNRDWHGTAAGLAERLPLETGGRVDVVNDLAALGHALPVLIPGQLSSLRAGRQQGEQALVAGVGTGFNVSLSAGGNTIEAELGHASLPDPLAQELARLLGRSPEEFPSVEELFSGRGLVRLHRALGGDPSEGGAEIVAAFQDGEEHVASAACLLGRGCLGCWPANWCLPICRVRGSSLPVASPAGCLAPVRAVIFWRPLPNRGANLPRNAQPRPCG